MEITINQNLQTGETGNFVDLTAYADYSDIIVSRFIFGNIKAAQEPQDLEVGASLIQYNQYQSQTLEAFTYDNKVLGMYSLIVPQISGLTVQADSIMRYSGYRVVPTDFLPTANFTPYVFTPSIVGVEPVGDRFPDMVYSLTYEVYEDSLVTTNVVSGKQYMVVGSGTCTYNGSIYRENEVFIASDNGGVTFSGSASLGVLYDLVFKYFSFTYNAQKKLSDTQIWMIKNNIQDTNLVYRINVMYSKLNAVDFASIQDFVAATYVQDIIEDVNREIDYIINNYGI